MLSKKEFNIDDFDTMKGVIERRLPEFIEEYGIEWEKSIYPKKAIFTVSFDYLLFIIELECVDNVFYFKEMSCTHGYSKDTSVNKEYNLKGKTLYSVAQKMREFLHEN